MAAEQVLVFDACAVVALLDGEPGAAEVEALLQQTGHRCLIHVINVCEVYYHLYRAGGPARADQLTDTLANAGFVLNATLSPELWRLAGKLKAEWRRVSLADCFALALAFQQQGCLVTSDRHELERIGQAQICPIRFIR